MDSTVRDQRMHSLWLLVYGVLVVAVVAPRGGVWIADVLDPVFPGGPGWLKCAGQLAILVSAGIAADRLIGRTLGAVRVAAGRSRMADTRR